MTSPPTGGPGHGAEPREPEVARVEEVVRALGSALRSYRLYQGAGPTLDRFVETFRDRAGRLWEEVPALRLGIEEDRILWNGSPVLFSGEAGADLPFLFYKDGIRELTLLPGFEAEEVVSLLRVLSRAPTIRREEDDLITLLWQEDFAFLRYELVEPGSEGKEPIPAGAAAVAERVDPRSVRQDAALPRGITPEDFQETLYFLDEAELRRVREELGREDGRDLWVEVINALLDRLEDGGPDRQVRILGIVSELIPSALASASFHRAALILEQLAELARRPGALAPSVLRETRTLFEVLAREETVRQLAAVLEEEPARISGDALLRLLDFFPPTALRQLMAVSEDLERPAVRRIFETCVQRIAERDRAGVTALLADPQPGVRLAALRWVGRLGIGSAVAEVARFLSDPAPAARLAALEAVTALRAAAFGNAIAALLDDRERSVRLAAARALGALDFAPAAPAVEAVLTSKRFRDADRGEKAAVFEAYGRLTGAEGIPTLDRVLNSRRWLGRGAPSEDRVCAALALARVRHPRAREVLSRAAADADPAVRAAVARALRGEVG
jgi:hypothetical protein